MRFLYRAIAQSNRRVKGAIEAKDVDEAVQFLRKHQLMPIQVIPEDQSMVKFLRFKKGTGFKDIVFFTRQMASMLSAGLTLMQSLSILKNQIANQTMRDAILGIIVNIEEGNSFSQALNKYPKIFSPIYISLIKAAEASGLLDKVMMRLAENLEKREKLIGTIRSALIYPIIVITLMVVVVIVMMIFVIPQLSTLYDSLSVDLPLPTKIVIGASVVVQKYWLIAFFVVLAIVYYFRRWYKTHTGRYAIDSFVLRIPLFGRLLAQSTMTEFTRTFGLLVGTGTAVVESLNRSADVVGNILYINSIHAVSKRVEKGVSIGDAMSYSILFPQILVEMVRIGEQTGKLDESLARVSEYFEREVEQTVKAMTTAMEPAIMVILAVGVGFLIISIITPIYNLISAI